MTTQRQLRFGTFLAGTGSNMSSWRHPHAVADAAINFDYYKNLTQKAEAAKLDFAFFGDGLYISEKSHPNFLNRFEPLTLLATLAGCEMGLKLAGLNLAGRGVEAAMEYFAGYPSQSGVTQA